MRSFSLKTKILFFLFLFVVCSYHPTIKGSNTNYAVQSGDVWTYTVKSARRNFEYSFGAFESSINTRGYKLENEIVELGEEKARERELAAATAFLESLKNDDLLTGWVGPHAFFVDNSIAAR